MIFITVGTQFGFDRLIEASLSAIKKNKELCGLKIIIQASINDSLLIGRFNLLDVEHYEQLNKDDYNYYFNNSNFIISHVGMGTIITAVKKSKYLISLPRLAKFGEHRNDHQISSAKAFLNVYSNVKICMLEEDLSEVLKNITLSEVNSSLVKVTETGNNELLMAIENEVFSSL
ncbi:glycosyltransferase [Photobacterium sp. DNB23_23_1]